MSWNKFMNKLSGQPDSYEKKNNYEFLETLGAGTFGLVKKAIYKPTNEEVAVKIILRKKVKGKEQTVINELELLRSLDHPHIVEFKDWFESQKKYYLVTQLCTGGELFDRILDVGQFTEVDACQCIRQVAEAIQYLHHRNIVHRDIKPENLLYETPDRNAPLRLADFGIAKQIASSDEKIMNAAGSLGYAAPEIFGNEGHGKPCDVWSLGVVLFTVLSGRSPFRAEDIDSFLDEVRPDWIIRFSPRYWKQVSKEAKVLVARMIQYDPEDRPTIDEVLADPWFHRHENKSSVDLLPLVREGLSARARWRVAIEKVRLTRRLKELHDDETEEADQKQVPKFLEIVRAAQRQKEIVDEDNHSRHSLSPPLSPSIQPPASPKQ